MNSRRTFLKITFALTSVFVLPKFMFASKRNWANVLILGDSISIGYTPDVKEILAGWANVSRPMLENGKAENCQGTTNGVKNIKRWLGDTKWDVIHFNFGLHDIKKVDPETGKNSTNPNHPQQASLKQYKKNLTEIVDVLKETGATLIFATTTPYPDQVDGPLRLPGMPQKYNSAATKIMNKNGIIINNLYAFVQPRMKEIQKPHNVHFTKEGSRQLAQQVADRILEVIQKNGKKS